MKQLINSKRMSCIVLLSLIALLSVLQINAQVKKNKKSDVKSRTNVQYNIEGINFDIPDEYTFDEKIGDKTVIFKGELYKKTIYQFVTIAKNDSELEAVRDRIADKVKKEKTSEIQWKKAKPMLMLWESKYKEGETAYLGLEGDTLFNFVSRQITFKDKAIHVGFLYEWAVYSAKEVFKESGTSDFAIACNSAVTLINSITKEKTEKLQHCYLRLSL